MSENERFDRAITVMREYFSVKPLSANIKIFYWDALKNYGISAIEKGFKEFMLDAEKWPSVREITAYVSRSTGGLQNVPMSHFCEFEVDHSRCGNHGSISNGATGGGPWYCRVHARDQHSPEAVREVELSQITSPSLETPENLDWLDKNLSRRSGENDNGYAMRCKAAALAGLKTLRLKTFP